MSVSQLAQRLRDKGVPKTSGGKPSGTLGHLLADFVEKLQEAMAEAEEDASGQQEGLLAQLQQLQPDVTKADYFDTEAGMWDEEGLREDLELAKERRSAKAVEPVAKPVVEARDEVVVDEPEELLQRLMQRDPNASREDYFDEESSTWDMEGLKDDLRLSSGTQASGLKSGTQEAEDLLTELMALDANVTRADYFDEDSGEWDMDGLQEDLELAQDGERVFAQLLSLDGDSSRDDYFDAESGEWDLEGLQEDLALAQGQKETGAMTSNPAPVDDLRPEDMLAKLVQADPRVCKEDYFDEESGDWDLEGMKDDLSLMASREMKDPGDPEPSPTDDKQAEPSPATAPSLVSELSSTTEKSPEVAEETEEDVGISVGDHVNAKYKEEGWYTAVVTKDHGNGTFELKWDEDSTETPVSHELIQVLPPVTEGAAVYAVWKEDGGWYDAVVRRVIGDGTFIVKYDEDASEATLHKEEVRMKVDPPKEPQYWFAPYKQGQSPPSKGEKIEALWKDGDYEGWHPAVVQKDNGGGSFLVKWDEDDSETPVQRNEIRKWEARVEVSTLRVSQQLRGIVKNTTTFGAFVDVGTEVEGLVHISHLSVRRVNSVEEVVQTGQEVDVWVNRVNPDGKLALTMVKSRVEGPLGGRTGTDFSGFVDVPSDKWLTGKVVRLEKFGAFVAVAPPSGGVEQKGFVHVSEIREGLVEDIHKELEIGQDVHVRVIQVEKNRMTLSMV